MGLAEHVTWLEPDPWVRGFCDALKASCCDAVWYCWAVRGDAVNGVILLMVMLFSAAVILTL